MIHVDLEKARCSVSGLMFIHTVTFSDRKLITPTRYVNYTAFNCYGGCTSG